MADKIASTRGGQIQTISINDVSYPPLLREISQPPGTLWYRGTPLENEGGCFSVVGTRKPTYYGEEVTPKLVEELALAGLTIVSGLATGIDTLAHKAALKVGAETARGELGRTIAVLGCGVDDKSLFPKENLGLMHDIINAGGLILSEFPPGTPARSEHFPQRNRIISGISRGVLVIEAPTRSGSLITTRFALEQNREVFAVPGPITSAYSWGPNFLILQGAHPVLKAENILDEFGIKQPEIFKPAPRASHETASDDATARSGGAEEGAQATDDPILAHLSKHPVPVDEIVRKSGQPAHVVNAHLTALEIQNKIKNVGGGRYIKI